MDFPIITKTTEELEAFEKDRKAIMLDPQKMFYRKAEKGLRKPTRITFETLRRVSKSCSIARLAITTLKHEVAKTKWAIVPVNPKDAPDLKRITEIRRLFNFPNPDDNFRTFLLKLIEDILVLDAGCIELVTNVKGQLLEMYNVDGSTIKPNIDIHGTLGDPAYVQYMPLNNTDAADAEFDRDELLYVMQNPQGDIKNYGFGLSPLEGVIMVATNILNADNYNGSFFEVGTLPPLIINLGKNLPRTEVEAFKMYWKSEIEGKPWKTAFYGGGDSPEIMKLQENSNRDMQFMEYQNWLARLMCAAYEISPQDIGLTMEINKATSETQREISKAKGYRTVLEVIEEVFTQGIIWKKLGYEDLMFKWQEVDSVDELRRAQVWQIEANTGARSINEYRKEIGLDPIKGGIKPKTAMGGEVDYTPLEDMTDAEIEEEKIAEDPVVSDTELELGADEDDAEEEDKTKKEKANDKIKADAKKKPVAKSIRTEPAYTDEKVRQIGELLGIDFKVYPFNEFKMGMNEESEHFDVTGGDLMMTGKIAFAHLKEDANYYTKLESVMKAQALKKKEQIAVDARAASYIQKNIPPTEVAFIRATRENLKGIYTSIVEPQIKKIAGQSVRKGWVTINGNHVFLGDDGESKVVIRQLKTKFQPWKEGDDNWRLKFVGRNGEKVSNKTNGKVSEKESYRIDGTDHSDMVQAVGLDQVSALDSGIMRISAENESGATVYLQTSTVPTQAQIDVVESHFSDSKIIFEQTSAGVGMSSGGAQELVQAVDVASGKEFGRAVRSAYPQVFGSNPLDQDYEHFKSIKKAEGDSDDDDDYWGEDWDDDENLDSWEYAKKKDVSLLHKLVIAEGLGLLAKLVADSVGQPNKQGKIGQVFSSYKQDFAGSNPFDERSRMTAEDTAKTLRDDVRSYLENARQTGLDFDEMATDITGMMGLQDDWRGKRIARTESVWATKETTRQLGEELDIDSYEVLYGSDPCEHCIELFGDGSGPFAKNDIDQIPVHPNCECVANLIIPDDWKVEDYI
jgi:hypothetical protein